MKPMQTTRDHQKWQDYEEALLRQLVAEALDYAEIARRMKRSEESIRQHVYKYIGPKTRRREWTTREMAEARRLREAGMSYAQIGERIGRTPSTVYQALTRG